MELELVKIADFDDEKQRVAYSEAKAAAKKKGCRLLTPDEYLSQTSISPSHKLWSCVPFWLEGGLLARRFDCYGSVRGVYAFVQPSYRYGSVRGVYAFVQPSYRYGVVGTPIGKAKPHKHEFKCECGATRKR